jgi:nickel-dependent lactate racemase
MMRYGRHGFPLDLSDDLDITVIRKKAMPIIGEPERAVRYALNHPVGSRALNEELKESSTICVMVCDITRPAPNGLVLPVLLEELLRAGVHPDAITILIATGLHRPNEGEEMRDVIGSNWVLETVKVANHFGRSEEDHVFLGTTLRGLPVKLDRRFVEADVRIVIGLVEPHFMAGYSGGRKLIVPGVCAEETIRRFHSTSMLDQEMVKNCVVDGNPVHEEQIAIVRMAGGSLAINTVIDEERNLSFVNFGEVEKSHREAVSFARLYFEVPLQRRFRTIVTTGAGYPLDRNFYQTVKGMVAVADIAEERGNIFILSECAEGLGTNEYALAQKRLIQMGPEAFIEETRSKLYADIDEWQSVMQAMAMRAGNIHLYSSCLPTRDGVFTGVNRIESIAEAVEESARQSDGAVAVVPEGPYVIPVFAKK